MYISTVSCACIDGAPSNVLKFNDDNDNSNAQDPPFLAPVHRVARPTGSPNFKQMRGTWTFCQQRPTVVAFNSEFTWSFGQ